TLALQKKLGDKVSIGATLEILAQVAAQQGMPNRAARLLGAAEALREGTGVSRWFGGGRGPFGRAAYDRLLVGTRATLGDVVYAAEWVEGRATPIEQAITEALGAI